jgi:hypothetical protein
MQYIIARFLEDSHIDPIYLVTAIVDIVSVFLWLRLKNDLTVLRRSLYTSMIVVAMIMTAGVLCKVFGYITDWKDLMSFWTS